MKNPLPSLVLIQQYYSEGNDIIQAYGPLVLYILNKSGESQITLEEIQILFCAEYGINITRFPLTTILNRLKPEYISQKHGKIIINRAAVSKAALNVKLTEERNNLNLMLNDFIDYCKNFAQPVVINYQEADLLFSDFLESHDSELLFALNNDNGFSILDVENNIKDPDKIYLLNRYIFDQLTKKMRFSIYIVHAALGHLYSSTMLYRDFLNVRGNAVVKNCYLDTNILFDIFGINGDFRRKTCRQFIGELTAMGTNVRIFDHNFQEFLSILEGCIKHIQSSDYQYTKASRALKFFRDNDYSKESVQAFIGQIPQTLKQLDIVLSNSPNPNKNQEFQIDREALKQCIVDVYNRDGKWQCDEAEENQTIEIDIDSIEYIYKLRGSSTPISIGDVSDVLLTTNTGLAYASTIFQKSMQKYDFFTIPTVITDVFLGTMIWIQAPSDLTEDFSISKMITYTNAVIQPTDQLIEKLITQIEKAMDNKEQPLSSENAKMLLETNLARRLLSDSTLNDDERITAETPYDLMRALEQELTADIVEENKSLETKLEVKNDEAEKAKREAAQSTDELNQVKKHIEDTISSLARKYRWITVGILSVLLLGFAILKVLGLIPMIINTWIDMIFTIVGFGGIVTINALGKRVEEFFKKKFRKRWITTPILPMPSIDSPSSPSDSVDGNNN